MIEKIIYENIYNNHTINTSKERRHGCYKKALEKIDNTLTKMIKKHSKIMIVRFDLRYPTNSNYESNSQDINRFTYNLKRSLDREKIEGGHNVDAKVLHVEEKNTSNNTHHHYAVIVNGNVKNNYYPIVEKAEKIWKKTLNTDQDGLVDFCNRIENGIIIDRNNENRERELEKAYFQLSYLAKINGKQDRKKGSWLIKSSH